MSLALNVNLTLVAIIVKYWGIKDLKCCDYYHLVSDFSSKFQLSMKTCSITKFLVCRIRSILHSTTPVAIEVHMMLRNFEVLTWMCDDRELAYCVNIETTNYSLHVWDGMRWQITRGAM